MLHYRHQNSIRIALHPWEYLPCSYHVDTNWLVSTQSTHLIHRDSTLVYIQFLIQSGRFLSLSFLSNGKIIICHFMWFGKTGQHLRSTRSCTPRIRRTNSWTSSCWYTPYWRACLPWSRAFWLGSWDIMSKSGKVFTSHVVTVWCNLGLKTLHRCIIILINSLHLGVTPLLQYYACKQILFFLFMQHVKTPSRPHRCSTD